MAILSFVFTMIISFQIEKYPLFLLSGLLPWNFFSKGLSEATASIVEDANLVKKAYFPREALPIASVLSNFISLLFALLILLVVLILFGRPLNSSIIFLPAMLFLHILFASGLALALSCANVYLRDINSLVRSGLMLWFYITPIFYPLSMVPQNLQHIYKLNPMVSIITIYRDILFNGNAPHFLDFLMVLTTSTITAIVGYLVFRKYQSGFVKEI